MFNTTAQFIRHSLYPSKQALRLRLAPLHAYMLASLAVTFVVTFIDFLVLQPAFFWPMWLFLHGFAIFFFYMGLVAICALIVQLVTKWRTKKMWAYRQTWPYSVAMSLLPTVILVLLYHVSPDASWLGILLLLVYLIIPLFQVPTKKIRT